MKVMESNIVHETIYMLKQDCRQWRTTKAEEEKKTIME